MSEQKTIVQYITPEIAKAYLQNNHQNRNVSKRDVAKMARDMKAGNWVLTHQGILIGKNGALIDGQHRLLAIVMSGVTVKMQVTYDEQIGTPLELPLDTGRKRSASVSLGISNSLSAVSNFAFKISNAGKQPTLSELGEMARRIEPYFELLSKNTRAGVNAAVPLAAVAHLMNGADKDYVVETYNGIVGDYKTLAPYPASFFNQLIVERQRYDAYELLGRALRALDPSNKDKTKAQIKNRQSLLEETTEFIKSVFN